MIQSESMILFQIIRLMDLLAYLHLNVLTVPMNFGMARAVDFEGRQACLTFEDSGVDWRRFFR